MSDPVEVQVHCVRFDVVNKIPVVLLKDAKNQRFLPIWIGMFEATQIEIAIEKIPVPRPMSHDLMKSILDTFQLQLERIVVHDIVEGTFYAKLILHNAGGDTIELDARPSDAIALSLRTQTPIYVSDHILEEAAITGKEPDDEEIQKFKDFLSNVKPSDFKH